MQPKGAATAVTTDASYYHTRDREPPLPIYLGLMTHVETQKFTLVDKLYNLGLSISYDRVLELSTDMGNSVCAASAAMICLAIDVITKAVNFLNQGQVPVLACDHPLNAIAKKIQWNFPTVYGEKKLVVMFDGFILSLQLSRH